MAFPTAAPALWDALSRRLLDSTHGDEELRRRVALYVLISGVGIAFLLPMGVAAFAQGNPLLAVPDLLTAALLTANLTAAIHTQRYRRHIALGMVVAALFFSFIFATGGQHNTAFVWHYTFPLVCTFLLGSRRGVLVSFAMLLPVLAVFWAGTGQGFLTVYPDDLKIRFLASYAVVAIFAYAFEHYGERARQSLASARDGLEYTVAQRTRELALANEELLTENATRAAAEARSAADRNFLQSVIDAVPESLMVILDDYRVVLANRSSRLQAGLAPEEPLPEDLTCHRMSHDRDTPCDGTEHPCPLHRVLGGEAALTVEHQHASNGNNADSKATVEIMAVPVQLPGETRLGIVESCRDITLRRRLESEIHQAQKMHAIGTLAGGVAHEFNNILAAVLGHAELAERKSDAQPAVADHLRSIVKNSLRARDLVNQILTYSRVTPRQPDATVALATAAGEALRLIRPSLPAAIEITEEHHANPRVHASLTDVQQILMNLCTNACHAMRNKGTIALTIREQPVAVGDEGSVPPVDRLAVLAVSDRGHGIDAATRERLFDPFFTTKAVGEGTGMGLSVVQGLVKSLGGRIEVESRPGEGSTFSVHLPVAAPDAVLELPSEEGEEDGESYRVLLIDDDEAVNDALDGLLESLGHQALCFTEPAAAIEAIRADPARFDAVITDFSMPHLSGLEVARTLRDAWPSLPVILCTGYGEAFGPEELRQHGVTRVLHKPVRGAELSRTLQRAVRSHKNP